MAIDSTSPAKKPRAPKKPADHPQYGAMCIAAVCALKERKGSSGQAIRKYICSNYKVSDHYKTHVNRALRKCDGMKQVSGTGASGSYKVADAPKKAAKKPKTPKKKAAKKPAAKKVAKKVKTPKKKKAAPKKSAAKKPAPKKVKPATKKAKKPAVKKAAPKKPAVKKTAGKKKAAAKK